MKYYEILNISCFINIFPVIFGWMNLILALIIMFRFNVCKIFILPSYLFPFTVSLLLFHLQRFTFLIYMILFQKQCIFETATSGAVYFQVPFLWSILWISKFWHMFSILSFIFEHFLFENDFIYALKGFKMYLPKMCHFVMWITLSWSQSRPRRLRESFLLPVNFLKEFR